ncbi:MAG: redoxin domain-containing protein [Anaerolineales bacterium]|nr:redoxin domain-containing protein [Anaerolineales bacterium]
MNTQVLGISVDHVPALQAWADSFEGISYPLLSDFWPHGEVAKLYGVLREEGYTERAIFVIDAFGIIHYIDIHNIDDQPDNEVLFAELEKLQAKKMIWEPDVNEEDDILPEGGVIMYTTKWCPDSRRARAWLAENNIEYTEVNIYASPAGKRRVREITGGVIVSPVFDIEGEIVLDFNKEKLEKILLNK